MGVFSYLSNLISLSDEQVMLRLQKYDDSRAFALLLQRWQGRIQRLCIRMTADAYHAEDLTQEIFMRLYAHRKNFRGDGSFGSYLRRIAINRCYDYHRSLKRQPKYLSISDNGEEKSGRLPPSSVADPEKAACENEHCQLVRDAIFVLPWHYRQVVILRHYEGLKFRQIAEILEIPVGTVQSRMAESLTRLERLLKPRFSEKTDNNTTRQNVVKENRKGIL